MDEIAEAVLENDRLPKNQRKTNRELALELDTSERTIRRRRAELRAQPGATDSFFDDIPLSAIARRGRTVRLPDGSYEKVTYKPGAFEMESARRVSYEDLEHVFDAPVDRPTDLSPDTFVLNLADFQVGKTDENGGSAETIARVRRMLAQVVEDLSPCEEIIIADVGDSTEGFWNVASQAQTNDLSLTDQIRTVQRLHAEAIRMLAPLAGRLRFVSVPSNHCAVRTSTGGKNRANAPDDDFGLLIADNLEMVLEGREAYQHVTFHRPKKWEEAVTLKTFDGSHVAFSHGHLAGKQSRVPQWFADLAFGHRSGLEKADILVHGHFHNFSVGLTGDNRFVIGCPSADNGSSWFSNVSGKRSAPALLSFWVVGGKAEDWRLYYG